MNPRPNNRAVQTGDTITRTPVVGATQSTERKQATARDILGRDPNLKVMTGGTRLILREEPTKEQSA